MLYKNAPLKVLPFFPSSYPDEILYSVLSRYHHRACNNRPGITNLSVFDTEQISTNIDFSFNIRALHSKLPSCTSRTSQNLIETLTLYKLYKPFNTKEWSDRVVEEMLGPFSHLSRMYKMPRMIGRGSESKGISTYYRKTKNQETRFLRHCPICLRTDSENLGEAYWHRSHQIYGIDVCHKHGSRLIESDVPVKILYNRSKYTTPADANFRPAKSDMRCDQQLLSLANIVNRLLNTDHSLNLDSIKCWYGKKLTKLGFRVERSNFHDLKEDIAKFYARKGFCVEPVLKLKYGRVIWLENLLEHQGYTMHPLDHLMFINFLRTECRNAPPTGDLL